MAPRSRTRAAQDVLGVPAGSWLTPSLGRIKPGNAASWMKVPVDTARKMLPETTRLVADLPRTGSREVVWAAGADELRIATDRVGLDCRTGLVVVSVPVACDQLSTRAKNVVGVPLAVGTIEQPRGLMMSTFLTPSGPEVVTDVWSDALTAFAWETLLTLARSLAAAAGHDRTGRALVPVAIGAADDTLLVRPMAAREE